jgi:hypothetical protein
MLPHLPGSVGTYPGEAHSLANRAASASTAALGGGIRQGIMAPPGVGAVVSNDTVGMMRQKFFTQQKDPSVALPAPAEDLAGNVIP